MDESIKVPAGAEVFVIAPEGVAAHVATLGANGKVGDTGVDRAVYTPEWVAAAGQIKLWFAEAGLDVRQDAVGNVWGRLEGTEPGPSIVTGSHFDSQRPGGQYDGALGVIAGLLAVKAVAARHGRPRRTVEVLALAEEESSRFPGSNYWGSRAIVGGIRPEEADTLRAYSGEAIGEAMREAGFDPALIPTAKRTDIGDYIELHIEQGPVLENAGLPVAVVTAITGPRWYQVTLRGRADHAGARPMNDRRDPMRAFVEIAQRVIDEAYRLGAPAVTTVGRVSVEPNYASIVPSVVHFTIDARHPDPDLRASLYKHHEAAIRDVAVNNNVDHDWSVTWNQEPCIADENLVRTIEESATTSDIPFLLMSSGAGHDGQQIARIARVAMVFVRSKDGRSHCPEEYTSPEDAAAGIEVLAGALWRLGWS